MRSRFPRIVPFDAISRRRLLAGGLAAVVLTATASTAAFAQTATPTPSSGGRPAIVQQDQSALLNALAGRLGVGAADLLAAWKAAQKQLVAADLAAGRITSEQATQLSQRIDQATGLGPVGGPRGDHGGPGGGPGGRGAPFGDVATFLGLQPADLMASLQSGKTLAQVAQEKGKTRDELKAYLTSQERTRLAQAVTDGKLTQAQADQRLADLSTRLDQLIDSTRPAGGPRGAGPGAGPGGPRGGGPGGTGAPTSPGGTGAPATPTARQ